MPANERKGKNRFNKTGIEHSHKSGFDIKTAKLAIQVHLLMCLLTHSINLGLKAQFVVDDCAEVFVLHYHMLMPSKCGKQGEKQYKVVKCPSGLH